MEGSPEKQVLEHYCLVGWNGRCPSQVFLSKAKVTGNDIVVAAAAQLKQPMPAENFVLRSVRTNGACGLNDEVGISFCGDKRAVPCVFELSDDHDTSWRPDNKRVEETHRFPALPVEKFVFGDHMHNRIMEEGFTCLMAVPTVSLPSSFGNGYMCSKMKHELKGGRTKHRPFPIPKVQNADEGASESVASAMSGASNEAVVAEDPHAEDAKRKSSDRPLVYAIVLINGRWVKTAIDLVAKEKSLKCCNAEPNYECLRTKNDGFVRNETREWNEAREWTFFKVRRSAWKYDTHVDWIGKLPTLSSPEFSFCDLTELKCEPEEGVKLFGRLNHRIMMQTGSELKVYLLSSEDEKDAYLSVCSNLDHKQGKTERRPAAFYSILFGKWCRTSVHVSDRYDDDNCGTDVYNFKVNGTKRKHYLLTCVLSFRKFKSQAI